jgi:hypothetical protein
VEIKWRERGDMGGGRVRGAVARTSNAAFAEKARRGWGMRAIGDRAAGSGRTGGAEEQGEAQNAEADAGGNAGHVVGARTAVPSYDRAGECDAASIFACPRGFRRLGRVAAGYGHRFAVKRKPRARCQTHPEAPPPRRRDARGRARDALHSEDSLD